MLKVYKGDCMSNILEIINKFSEFVLDKFDPDMRWDHFLSTNHPLLSYSFLLFAFFAILYMTVGKNNIIKALLGLLMLGMFLFSILSGYTTSLKLDTSDNAMLENHTLVVYIIIAIFLVSFLSFLKQRLNCKISCLVAIVFAFLLIGSLIYTGVSIR